VPRALGDMDAFFDEMELSLLNGRIVHFFPEGELEPYSTTIRGFKKDAFYLAARARVPIVPRTISFSAPRGLHRLFKRKPVMGLTVGKPIYPVSADIKEDERARMQIGISKDERTIRLRGLKTRSKDAGIRSVRKSAWMRNAPRLILVWV